MKSARELSPQLAARLERVPPKAAGVVPQDALDNTGGGERRGGSDYSKLRAIIRAQKEQIQSLEHEVSHFQSRAHRVEDGHRLELSRLKKEVEYHKRLRQGADQRSYELEDRLSRLTLQQKQQQAAAAAAQRPEPGHDEEKDGLIAQSQLLVSKNSELSTRVKMLESQVSQLEELKAALESELNQAYCERDELAAELERILTKQHGLHVGHHSHPHSHDGGAEAEQLESYGEEADEDGGGAAGSAAIDGLSGAMSSAAISAAPGGHPHAD